MVSQQRKPARRRCNLGRISEAQDDAVDEATRVLSRRRIKTVFRADIFREALALYCASIGVDWPS